MSVLKNLTAKSLQIRADFQAARLLLAKARPSAQLARYEELRAAAEKNLNDAQSLAFSKSFKTFLMGVGGVIGGIIVASFSPALFAPAAGVAAAGLLTMSIAHVATDRLVEKALGSEMRDIIGHTTALGDKVIAAHLKTILKTPYLKENFLDRFPTLEARFKKAAGVGAEAALTEAIRQNRLNAGR